MNNISIKMKYGNSLFKLLFPLLLVLGFHSATYAQYCTPPILDCGDDDRLISISFAGIVLAPTCDIATGYNDFTASGPAGSVVRGNTYPITAEVGYEDDKIGVWIDFNHNNVFESSEFKNLGTATATNYSFSNTIAIPATALLGPTRMRVVVYWLLGFNGTNGSCLTNADPFDYGEVDDYTINIAAPVPPSCIAAPTAPVNAATSTCAGSTVLSWPAATGATGYDVYLNTGTGTPTTIVSTNQAGTTYSATTVAGPYVWMVVPKNTYGAATGCATWSFTAIPTVTPTVSIAASPGNNICTGTNVTFTATGTNTGAAPTFQWKKGTVNVGSNTASYSPAAVLNSETYSVVMTSNATCAVPATATSNVITMSVVPRPTAAIMAATTTVCDGNYATLLANTGTGLTYQWLQNNVIIPSATNNNFSAGVSGDYRVIVSNGSCADTSAITTITVTPLPTATTTLSGPTTFCAGSSLSILAPAGGSYTYQWRNNGIDIPGETARIFTTNAAGSYSVVVTASGCSATSAVITTTVLPAPVATITAGGPLSFCTPGSVVLSANAGTGLTYVWMRNGVAITPAATSQTYTGTISGIYTVVVSNGTCGTTSAGITVTASTLPSTAVTITGTTTFCQGNSVQLRAAQVTGYTYQWYRNGIAITGSNTFLYIATTAGAYYAVITNGACTATTTTTNITVNPLPVATATATGPLAFCENSSLMIVANTGTGLTYQWRRNGTPIPGETAASTIATQSGFYQVVVSNGICSATSNAITTTVSTMPAAVITPQSPTTFCQSLNVVLDATPGATYTYKWLKDGTYISGANSSSYTTNIAGNYTVEITNGTCVAVSPAEIVNVTTGPDATITPSGPLGFCQGGEVALNAVHGTNYTYEWLLNGVPVSGQTNATLHVTASGSYSLHVNDGACDATSAAVTVDVRPIPVVVITIASGTLMSAPAGYLSYQWYRNGIAIAGATGVDYTATHDGFYAVVVSDDLGCSATSSVQQITSLDINSTTKTESIKVFPNPAKDLVRIEASSVVDVTLTTIDGRVLMNKEQATSIDISAFANGVYLIRVNDHKSGALIKVDKLLKGN